MIRYYYEVHAQANAQSEIKFLVVPPVPKKENAANSEKSAEVKEVKIPQLTAEMVKQNSAYAEFAKQKFPLVMLTYGIYKIESDLAGVENVEQHLKLLIADKTAEFVANGELQITAKVAKKNTTKMKKNMFYGIIGGATALSMIIGVIIGSSLGQGGDGTVNSWEALTDSDGLIMPDAIEFCPNAELLTISIDRSWSPVPREDIQVRGELVNGVATITLPAFDRTDFFTHVPGHTWGFTSDPNGRRIEYYGGMTYNFTANTKLYRVLVRFGGGNGTQDDPFLVNYFDQLQLMSREQVRGFFRQTEDIEFPCWAAHTPINTVNELRQIPDAERFEFDGGRFIISGLNAPLFGTVSGSVIRNVNVTQSVIETTRHENFGFIVSQVFNFRYDVDGRTYETGETLIQNSTVSHSAMYLRLPEFDSQGNPAPEVVAPATPPPVIPPDLDTGVEQTPLPPPRHGEFAVGGITGVGGQIENCYVENIVIFAGLSDYFLHVGGISGKPANVINSGVVGLTIEGNIFHTGGIVGSAGGTRLYSADGRELPVFYGGNIQGNFVRNFTAYVENSAGGIVGESSTNVENALISNNYATQLDFRVGVFADDDRERLNPIHPGIVGGIIGTDGNERHGHLVVNTVSDAFYPVIGRADKSTFDDTVRLAPPHAFSQAGILDVMNRNTVCPSNPSVIFAGSFMFAEDLRNSDEAGAYAFPAGIAELFDRAVISHE